MPRLAGCPAAAASAVPSCLQLNGERVLPPLWLLEGRLLVRFSGIFLRVYTDFGLQVRYDGNHIVEVKVPSTYSQRLCGLCGESPGPPHSLGAPRVKASTFMGVGGRCVQSSGKVGGLEDGGGWGIAAGASMNLHTLQETITTTVRTIVHPRIRSTPGRSGTPLKLGELRMRRPQEWVLTGSSRYPEMGVQLAGHSEWMECECQRTVCGRSGFRLLCHMIPSTEPGMVPSLRSWEQGLSNQMLKKKKRRNREAPCPGVHCPGHVISRAPAFSGPFPTL